VQLQQVTTPAATTSITATLNGTIKAGNAIIIGVGTYSPKTDGTLMVTDSLGNTYVEVVGPVSALDAASDETIFATFGADGGNDVITVNINGSTLKSYIEVYAHEYSGVTGFDVGTSQRGTNAGTDGIQSGFVNTSQNNELIFAYVDTGIANAGTGFTSRCTLEDDLSEELIVADAGSYQATATMTQGNIWLILMAAFKGQ
jgi:hypothetical protein